MSEQYNTDIHMSNIYRLYIDESGNHNYSSSPDIGHKYLGLTGVIVDVETYEKDFQPRIQAMKKLFSTDPDDLPILHREDIINKTGDFTKLNDPETEKQFNSILMSLLKDVDYHISAVVIDKAAHFKKYQTAAMHPYHYCLTTMLERYVHFLEVRGRGDVLSESRGTKEDMSLKEAYQHFYNFGTNFRTPASLQQFLTSKEIKIKSKQKAVAGLELADLLSLPTKLDVLRDNKLLPALTENFTKRIIDEIQPKYCVGNSNHHVRGYGKKLL